MRELSGALPEPGTGPTPSRRQLLVGLGAAVVGLRLGLVVPPADAATDGLDAVTRATPLVQERVGTLLEAANMVAFLLDDRFQVDPDAAAKQLGHDARPTLEAARSALAGLSSFTTADIEAALRDALVEGLGLKPKHAFGPIRVAITGSTVSPPLFESIELLGKDRTLVRLDTALS